MKNQQLSDLLPAFTDQSDPDPYRIFGLAGPVGDMNEILVAIKHTVSRLQESKSVSDPGVWADAAQRVKNARAVLADPVRKGQLDDQIVRSAESPKAPVSNPPDTDPFDPLAGILPTTDPLRKHAAPATAPGTPEPSAPAKRLPTETVPTATGPTATGTTATGTTATGPTTVPEKTTPVPAAPVIVPPAPKVASATRFADTVGSTTTTIPKLRRAPKLRRQGFPAMTCLFSIVAVALMATVGVLGYFVFFKEKTIAITQTKEGVVFRTGGQTEASTTRANPPTPLAPNPRPQPNDPVMDGRTANEDLSTMVREPVPMDSSLVDLLNTDSSPLVDSSPSMTPDPSTTVREQRRRHETAFRRAAELIRNRDWKRMVPESERVRNLPLSGQQAELASGLYSTAFLFEYYHDAIQRGYSQLHSGSLLKLLPPDIEFPVVSVAPERLTLLVDRKNETYSVDQLPFVIADHLASMVIENEATRELAAATYHCLAANSTRDVQKSELAWIRGFQREVQDIDVQQVADAIEVVIRGR